MSGALSNIYNNADFALRLHAEAMARLQEQASTGSRINRASDDPSAASRILSLNSEQKSLAGYIDGLRNHVVPMLKVAETAVDSMKYALSQVNVRLGGVSGASGATGIAEEINDWLEAVVSSANKNSLGQYIFGGSNTTSAPYLVERTNGKITSVTYQGNLGDRDIEVAPGVESSAFHVGQELFRSNNRETPTFPDSGTGAAAGTGTSNVTGDAWLTVTQDTDPDKYRLSINGGTDYVTVDKGKGSEVQELDFESKTPTGGSFTLTFDGQTTGAIQWDEGKAEVQAALENLSNLFAGDVTVDGSYGAGFTITFADTLGNVPELVVPAHDLVDGGGAITITPSTTTEGVGDANLAVTDSTGRVLYVNTTGITGTGVDWVRVPGTYDIFNTLITIRNKLEQGVTSAELEELRNNSLQSLEELNNLLTEKYVSIGSKMGFLDDLRESLVNVKYDADDQVTYLEQADIAQVAIDLSRREVLYQMTLAVTGRLMSLSLLDFIR